MCQVTTTWQIKTHDAVMRIEQGSVHCKVGWTAANMEESALTTIYSCKNHPHKSIAKHPPARVGLHIDSPAL